MIGGTYGAFKIDVLKYNVIRNRFSQLYAEGAKPSARSYFATTRHKECLYIYGGRGWVTVDNMDKEDMWQYNVTKNFWAKAEPTGLVPHPRWGHTAVTFLESVIVFGGHTTAEFLERGQGDSSEIWRYEVAIGSLVADSKFPRNVEGWKGFQNEVQGDALIPMHCDDYASKFGDYWGMPCKLTYDRASKQLLWIDSQHNDTNNTCPYLGCNGVGYMSAPFKFTLMGLKSYQGRLRYRYKKVCITTV